jgi:hypothetical protein
VPERRAEAVGEVVAAVERLAPLPERQEVAG